MRTITAFTHGWAGGCVGVLALVLFGCPAPEESPAPGGAKSVEAGTLLFVPATDFQMGNPQKRGGQVDEKPVHVVSLSDFEIGEFEITNQQFCDMLNWALGNGRITNTPRWVMGFDKQLVWMKATACQIVFSGGQYVPKIKDGIPMGDFPMVEVSWYGAAAYCNWLSEIEGLDPTYDTTTWECDRSLNGYRLPTEAEWERAAGWNGVSQNIYGNGSNVCDCTTANFGKCNPFGFLLKPTLSTVGYYNGDNGTLNSPSPAGCYDMSGNVCEWVNDWYSETYYAVSEVHDPAGPASGVYKAVRGGSWLNAKTWVRSADRFYTVPTEGFDNQGFRLARSVQLVE